MFYEYAVDPALADDYGKWRYVFDQCGPANGRFVSVFPRGEWLDEILPKLTAIRSIDDKLRQKLESKIVRRDRWGGRGETWLERAHHNHLDQRFRAIIASEDPDDDPDVLVPYSFDDEEDLWRTEPSTWIPKTPQALASALSLLLHKSKSITLIDPYFRARSDAYREPLSAMLQAAVKHDTRMKSFKLHIQMPDSKERRTYSAETVIENCRNELPKLIPSNMKLSVFMWEELDDLGEEFHDRALLINEGAGVFLGAGASTGKSYQNLNISRMGRSHVDKFIHDFSPETQTYELVGEIRQLRGT